MRLFKNDWDYMTSEDENIYYGGCYNYDNNKYWYKNDNGDLIKKDTCLNVNLYYL